MKIGDLIYYKEKKTTRAWGYECEKGVLLDFIPATHPKETQKIKVLTNGKIETWIHQYCEVVK